MKNYRKPRQEENTSRRARRASQKKVMLAGWIFLGVMLIAAIFINPKPKGKPLSEEPENHR